MAVQIIHVHVIARTQVVVSAIPGEDLRSGYVAFLILAGASSTHPVTQSYHLFGQGTKEHEPEVDSNLVHLHDLNSFEDLIESICRR